MNDNQYLNPIISHDTHPVQAVVTPAIATTFDVVNVPYNLRPVSWGIVHSCFSEHTATAEKSGFHSSSLQPVFPIDRCVQFFLVSRSHSLAHEKLVSLMSFVEVV